MSSQARSTTRSNQPSTANCAILRDVLVDDYACYSIIRLRERTAIDGYSDGTFRLNNAVTRGELSKIVVKGFGWPIDTSNSPHFRDIAPGSPFFGYIETMFNHGAISGFPEPSPLCTEDNNGRSEYCFRQNDPVTRGQLAKIVSNAAGFTDDTGGRPASFTDVGGHLFFGFIEKLVINGVTAPAIATCSSNPPCFSPNASSPRKDVVVLVWSGYERFATRGTSNSALVYGMRGGIDQGPVLANRYTEVGGFLSFTTLNVSDDVYGLVSAGDPWNRRYIQVGYKRVHGEGSATSRRYARYQDGVEQSYHFFVDTSLNLSVGYPYKMYVVDNGATNQWFANFCYTTCDTVLTADNLLVSDLPFAYAGGEGRTVYTRIGLQQVSTAEAQIVGSALFNWCWESNLPPQRTGSSGSGGVISPCSNYGWTVDNNGSQ